MGAAAQCRAQPGRAADTPRVTSSNGHDASGYSHPGSERSGRQPVASWGPDGRRRGLGGIGQTLGRPMRIGGMVLPTWAILGGLGAAYYMASGGRKRRR